MTWEFFALRMSLENAAFAESQELEVARILREIAAKLEKGDDSGICRDYNGNKVGKWGFDLKGDLS